MSRLLIPERLWEYHKRGDGRKGELEDEQELCEYHLLDTMAVGIMSLWQLWLPQVLHEARLAKGLGIVG